MDGETEKGIVYCIENGEVGIAGYGGLGDEPAIPESIDGYPVTSILNSAFANCDIKSINIPKNIRNVGDNAFEGCSALENVYYNGTYADWESINKGNGNECLENAVWHYKIPSSGVSFYAASADSAAGSVLIEGDYDVVSSVETGSEITIRAIPSEGYRFSYWKNRSGKVLSTDAEETFRINTNTAIFAEFSKITAADDECVNVSFYNENGFSLGKRIAEKGESFGNVRKDIGIPELTGYKFLHWSIYSDKSPLADETPMNSDLDAVAIFGDTGQLYTVKVNGANYGTSFKYGEKVSVTSTDEKFRCWKIGDKVLSYRRTYEFFVWGDISISSDIYGEERPVAMFVSVEETPMLIYDVPQGFEIVEAGILFGSNKRIHIASLDGSKATARQMTGQFTAQPHTGASEATVARGYLIYKTPEKEIRVIYAD